jgi:hypothetical protein
VPLPTLPRRTASGEQARRSPLGQPPVIEVRPRLRSQVEPSPSVDLVHIRMGCWIFRSLFDLISLRTCRWSFRSGLDLVSVRNWSVRPTDDLVSLGNCHGSFR